MYEFVDVTEQSTEDVLPSEALSLNGEYIENQISGYRTLSVTGRELLAPEVDLYTVGRHDGGFLQSRRFPERVITITYQLIAESNEAFREAFNQLNYILSASEENELIFHDEEDKFFTGLLSEVDEVDAGVNSVVSSFSFTCPDPFKYSVQEYEVNAQSDGSILIDYDGTYKAYPKLCAKMYESKARDNKNGDTKYIAFTNESEKIIQLGVAPVFKGEEEPAEPETLINDIFDSFDTNVWKVNEAPSGTPHFGSQVGGFRIFHDASMHGRENYLGLDSFGTGSGWHGPSLSRNIPDTSDGRHGSSNFTATWKWRICKNDPNQAGYFYFALVDSSTGKRIYLDLYDGSGTVGYDAYVYGQVGSIERKDWLKWDWNNPYWGYAPDVGLTNFIQKNGSVVTFNIGGKIQYNLSNPDYDNFKADKICMGFEAYGSHPAFVNQHVYWVKFQDSPNNTFTTNDEVIADCSDASIWLNDIEAPSYGALGNDWEEFYLKPGINQIGTMYGGPEDQYKPSFSVKFRERFI